mmetsp:Transcript_67799/g.209774  ORF Transcript_67799/g.209774 Transcript_67799/m.209774 type:complete len:437 (-) Transcript_67799:85-1395(-)
MHRGCAWGSNNQGRVAGHCTNKVLAAKERTCDARCRQWIILRDEEDQWVPVDGYDHGCGYLLEPLPTGGGPPPKKYRQAHEQAVKALLQEKAKVWGTAKRLVEEDPEARQLCLGGPLDEKLSISFVAEHLAAFSLVNLDHRTGCCTAPFANPAAEALLGVDRGDIYSKPVVQLFKKGYVVIDNAIPEEVLQAMRAEADKQEATGTMKAHAGRQGKQRGDKICWVDETWLSIPVPQESQEAMDSLTPTELCVGAWLSREALSAGVALLKGVGDALNPALTARHNERREAGFVEHQAPPQPPATPEAVLTVAPKAMLASYPADSIGYIPHQDSTFRSEFRNRTNPRELTAILYLNPPDWDVERDGGELRLYPDSEHLEQPPQDAVNGEWPGTQKIAPLGGRLVVFFSRLWHEVLPAKRERRALTLWIFRPSLETKAAD